MALVAPGICRYSLNHTYLGRPAVNILDIHLIGSGPGGPGRETKIERMGRKIIDSWVGTIMQSLSSSTTFNSVSYVDLDSEDGVTGTVVAGDGVSLPQAGAGAGAPISANTTTLVTKQGLSARGQRNGRWFLTPPTEDNINGNTIAGSYVTALQGRLDTFLLDMINGDDPDVGTTSMAIVHTKNTGTPTDPIITWTGNTDVIKLVANNQVASQRRRNRP